MSEHSVSKMVKSLKVKSDMSEMSYFKILELFHEHLKKEKKINVLIFSNTALDLDVLKCLGKKSLILLKRSVRVLPLSVCCAFILENEQTFRVQRAT